MSFYQTLGRAMGCQGRDQLRCLRALPLGAFFNISQHQVGQDLVALASERPVSGQTKTWATGSHCSPSNENALLWTSDAFVVQIDVPTVPNSKFCGWMGMKTSAQCPSFQCQCCLDLFGWSLDIAGRCYLGFPSSGSGRWKWRLPSRFRLGRFASEVVFGNPKSSWGPTLNPRDDDDGDDDDDDDDNDHDDR